MMTRPTTRRPRRAKSSPGSAINGGSGNIASYAATAPIPKALVWAWRRHGERAKAYATALKGQLETDLSALLGKIKEAAR